MSTIIRQETDGDRQAVGRVNRAAFQTAAEAELVDALRDGGFTEVSLVAEIDGEIVGHIVFSRLSIVSKAASTKALSLAPMAVLPGYQRRRIGSELVVAGLEACRRGGHRIVLVLGHPAFYPRFGFSAESAHPLRSPFGGGEAWMALELVPGALQGVEGQVEFSPPFGTFE